MDDKGSTPKKKKEHKSKSSGKKGSKKKVVPTDKPKNVKAFAIQAVRKAERRFRRKEDLITKKQHIPLVDKTPEEPPPFLVAVVGPSKVGKSTLIRNLIRNFTRTNVTNINGPVTIVTSKKRRITLLECNNDINSMIDVAKCADLVLLLCDASFGFEMEVFEFLNVCQVHGMPKIMGVLTHLDAIKNAKALKRQKKMLKHRFWTEVYQGAKLFYLSGILHGDYLRNEIKNLARFISVIKLRPLSWRSAHSYVLADRFEDITSAEAVRKDPKCDRDVVLYGYVRGIPLKKENMIHIAGFGDVHIDELSHLSDPCPLPSSEKKRSLLEKERIVYAPMSGVGGVVYDKDAVYIELQGSHSHKKEGGVENELVSAMVDQKETLDAQIADAEFRFFSDGGIIKSSSFIDEQQEEDEASEGSENDSGVEESDGSEENDPEKPDLGWQGGESDDEEPEEGASSDEEYEELPSHVEDDEEEEKEWRQELTERTREAFLERQSSNKNLMRLVYQKRLKDADFEEEPEELGGLFRSVKERNERFARQKSIQNQEESSFAKNSEAPVDWLDEEQRARIQNLFVTGTWKDSEDANELLRLDDMSDGMSEDGDFEDLETGKKVVSKRKKEEEEEPQQGGPESKKLRLTRVEEANLTRSEIMARKMKLKAKFDADYDNKELKDDHWVTGDHGHYEQLKAAAAGQSELNRKEFANLDEDIRLQVEGFRAGLYVRMAFRGVPCEFSANFNPVYPILIGALNVGEENIGFVTAKVKKHRWYKRTLKTEDPLIISMGWRRFQTIPIFAKVEDDMKQRYLKYTPNHVTCSMTFFGPVTPQNTGFLAVQSVTNDVKETRQLGFRIAATGAVSENDKVPQIMKKLKLVGTPVRIYKKSAFVKDMFTSSLEVAKFEGAKIKTVSGIRGQIKKAVKEPEGAFRATFEDKIVLSDIVFCRTWYQVTLPRFFAPVTNMLLPEDRKSEWQGMKTLGQLKRERNIRNQPNVDSLYTQVEREEKKFKPLVIPKALQKALPYKDKPVHGVKGGKKSVETNRIAVVRPPHEQKVATMMKMIKANFSFKEDKKKALSRKKLDRYMKEKEAEEMRKLKAHKEMRKQVFKTITKMDTSIKSTRGNKSMKR